MTHIETARFNEVVGLQIAAIRVCAQDLNENGNLEELESAIAELESKLADLKASVAAVPHGHPSERL